MRSSAHPIPSIHLRARDGRGFTLVELLVTLAVLALVTGALLTIMYTAVRSKTATSNRVESAQGGRAAIDMIARDLRSAGYGADLQWGQPQPPIAYVDSLQILICADLNRPSSVPLTGFGPQAPRAYDPAGNPRPHPISGTAWEPPIKYRTGAEIIRWTLDLNNDGVVNTSDYAHADGQDAVRTPNPNDWMLVRQVFGDSAYAATPGDNKGYTERVALVRRPATGSTPSLFTVYLKGQTDPWNWSDGPVPAVRVGEIERVTVRAVSTSSRPNWLGKFAETRLETEVFSLRNVPDFGQTEYAVDGYVFEDVNSNGTKDTGEPGLNASVRLGTLYSGTDANGYFLIRAPAGTYTLRHTPPAGYVALTSPDSFVVTIGPATTRSFADASIPGGTVIARVFNDLNGDGDPDTGEPWKPGVRATVTPGNDVRYTDAQGTARLFAPVGAFTVTITVPDSFLAISPNPQSGTMAYGDSSALLFAVQSADIGTIEGTVYRDNNRNGLKDVGEPGVENVWVGVQLADAATTLGYAYTNASGGYSIDVPHNDPPGTNLYYVSCLLPGGHFATSSQWLGPHLVSTGEQIIDQNFGIVGYQIITLNASRVLSLANTDLIEKDWTGSDSQWDTKGHQDADIVLGADAGGTDNVSMWFNAYNSTPVFDPNPTYTRNAPQSVLAIGVSPLDSGNPEQRPDLVTGTRNAGPGNWFVWLNQNTGGNLGYIPTSYSSAYRTADAGDAQSILLYDCTGGSGDDVIVGTRSPITGRGTFEVWENGEGASPVFTRQETYPPAGSIPGGMIGEVTAMALGDFDADGTRDLVVGTRTSSYAGELVFFRLVTRGNGTRFVHRATYTLYGDAVTSVVATDVDRDGRVDVVAGTQSATNRGRLLFYRNEISTLWSFVESAAVNGPGVVLSVTGAPLGGLPGNDLIVGWRESESSYVGGVLVYSTDSKTIPSSGADPSGGSIAHMVPATTVANFNYGVEPSIPPPPFLVDFASGVKITNSTGALVVFIR